MQIRDFNAAHATAKRRIRREGIDAVAPAEAELRALLPQLESDDDRRLATNLIKRLPGYAVPLPPPSALMLEAKEIERAAYGATGTVEERIATMAEARRKIFEIAERASPEEAPGIQGLTRVLEHLEDSLRDPYWPEPGPSDGDGR
jgi:hypothetical protein